MTQHFVRLSLVDDHMMGQIQRLSAQQQKSLAAEAARLALETCEVSTAATDQGIRALSCTEGTAEIRESIGSLREQLDEQQWNLQPLVDDDQTTSDDRLMVFGRARAVHALWFALDTNPFTAATESIYEAHAAGVPIEVLARVVEDVSS